MFEFESTVEPLTPMVGSLKYGLTMEMCAKFDPFQHIIGQYC